MLHAFKEQGKLLMDALHLTNKALKKPCGPVVTNDFVYAVHYYRYLIALGKQLGTILNISKNIYLKTLPKSFSKHHFYFLNIWKTVSFVFLS